MGTAVGLVAWFAFAPTLQSLAAHRIDPFKLPWWGVIAAMFLAFITSVLAAWWPARTVTRLPVIAALSGRPPHPQPAHRFAALGIVLLGSGIVLLAFADQHRAGFIIGGTVITAVGLLFFAPLAIRVLARAGRGAPISVRLALRDLVRYQARSGAALGAVTLALAIAATIAISAAAADTPAGAGNLEPNQMILYVSQPGAGSQIPPLTAAQQQTATTDINQLAAALHGTSVLQLEAAYDPKGGLQPSGPGNGPDGYLTPALAQVTTTSQGTQISGLITLYVATPAVLAHYGIAASQINPTADVISSRRDLGGLQVFDPDIASPRSRRRPHAGSTRASAQ